MNWKVRIKQKWFWLTLIPLAFLFLEQAYALVDLSFSLISGRLAYSSTNAMQLVLELVSLAFAILAIIGFPVDLTTDGYTDSVRAMGYEVPKKGE